MLICGVVEKINLRSERALSETDLLQFVEDWGGQVRSFVKDPEANYGVCFEFSKLRAWSLCLIITIQRPFGSYTAVLIVAGRFLTLH